MTGQPEASLPPFGAAAAVSVVSAAVVVQVVPEARLPVVAHLVVDFGAPAGPPQPPVVLSRNGEDFQVTGGTNLRAGTEIKVATERPTLPLTLNELDRGSWVIFERPGFTTAASRAPLDSLDALRKASATSYLKDKDALWVKVVSTGDAGTGAPGGGTSVQVSR